MELRLKFLNWLGCGHIRFEAPKQPRFADEIRITDSSAPTPPSGGSLNTNGAFTNISIVPAINGRIIQIGNYRANMHGPDWTYEHYIVPEGESLEGAMTVILLMKGMK